MPILLFADLDALRLALASGAVPAAIAAAPARAALDSLGRVWLQTETPLSRTITASLTRLGIPILGGQADVELSPIACWLEMFAPVRAMDAAKTPAPALLLVPGHRAAAIAAEVKRLSPESEIELRISDSADDVMLRVKPCPTFTLLAGGNLSFLEQQPRIWVQAGFEHPLAQLIEPPAGQFALVQASGTWNWLPEEPFAAELREFDLPEMAPGWLDADCRLALEMPLRLVEGRTGEPAELWLIREKPFEQLERFAREAGQALVERFRWAVIQAESSPIVLLWARQMKGKPPVAVVDGLGFRTYLKLPQLFVPCGYRLSPPLRRDVVRQLCGEAANDLTLLLPAAQGEFQTVRAPESAFEPLEGAVEFAIDGAGQALKHATPGKILEWDPFVVEEAAAKPIALPRIPPRTRLATPAPTAGMLSRLKSWWKPSRARKAADLEGAIAKALPPNAPAANPEAPGRLSELLIRRTKLEKRFLEAMRSPDPAEGVALLPELAAANAQLGHLTDAAACWLTAIWQHPAPPRYWLWGWLQVEKKLGRAPFDEHNLRALVEMTPSPGSVRMLAASVVWLSGQQSPSQPLCEHAGAIRALLEACEPWLPIRAVWLAQLGLTRAAGGDALALARTRDRLNERLYQTGLSVELDLPSFLRFAGRAAGERFPAVRDWLLRLRDSAHRWIDAQARQRPADYLIKSIDGYPDQEGAGTKAIVDLMLAWGLARLGEATAARHLARPARDALVRFSDPVYTFLGRAFEVRMLQALDGKSAPGSLPAELLQELERHKPTPNDDRPLMTQYRINCLRQHSRILEPAESVNAYLGSAPRFFQSEWMRTRENPEQVDSSIGRLLQMPRSAVDRAEMLGTALALAPRLGPRFAGPLLARVGSHLDRVDDGLSRVLLTGDALAIAALFDLHDAGRGLLEHLLKSFAAESCRFSSLALQLLRSLVSDRHHGPDDLHRLEALPGQCLRVLRRLGLNQDLNRLRASAIEWILQGEPLGNLRRAQPDTWLPALRAMLHLSGGSSDQRDDEQATLLLDAGRQCLLYTDIASNDKVPLACAYAAALGQAPVRVAQGRVEEMFRDLTGLFDLRQTNTHFALALLRVIDSVVRSLVADEFMLGPGVRGWLADDEFLVRRRMQQDLQAAIAARSTP